MLEKLIEIDKDLLLYLNGLNNDILDVVMFYGTQRWFWIPLYLLVFYWLIKTYKWGSIFIILGLAIAMGGADLTITYFMKPFFARFRPTWDPEIKALIHTVNGYSGGRYGFVSSHAATSFGGSFFLWLSCRNQLRSIGWLFLWAAFYSYTRIYLGVHFPGDILGGIMVGFLMAGLGYFFVKKTGRAYLYTETSL